MTLFANFLNTAAVDSTVTSRALWRDDYEAPAVQDERDIAAYESADPVERHAIVERLLADELAYLNEYDQCYYCRVVYLRAENLGRHQCRYHPGSRTATQFTCCGLPVNDTMHYTFRGCRPCDHLPTPPDPQRWTDNNVFYEVPVVLRDRLGFDDAAIVRYYEHPTVKGKSHYKITRVEGYRRGA